MNKTEEVFFFTIQHQRYRLNTVFKKMGKKKQELDQNSMEIFNKDSQGLNLTRGPKKEKFA